MSYQKPRRPPEWYEKQYGLPMEAACALSAAWERALYDNGYSYGVYVGMVIMLWCCRQIDLQQKAEMVQDASHIAWEARRLEECTDCP